MTALRPGGRADAPAAGSARPAREADYLRRPVMTYARNTRPFRELKDLLFERVGPDVEVLAAPSETRLVLDLDGGNGPRDVLACC